MIFEPVLVLLLSVVIGIYARARGHSRWRYFLASFLGWYAGEVCGFLVGAGLDVIEHGQASDSRLPFLCGMAGVVVVYPLLLLGMWRRLHPPPPVGAPPPPLAG